MWSIRPVDAADAADLYLVASMCVDEFEDLPVPFLPLPGWKKKAREKMISGWLSSRLSILNDESEDFAMLMASRTEAIAGRCFQGVEDDCLGFVELGLLPAPPELGEEVAMVTDVNIGDATPTTIESVASQVEQYPHMANLFVKEGMRKFGLGKQLVLAAEKKAIDFGYDRMYINVERENLNARRLYDKMGYRFVSYRMKIDPRTGLLGSNIYLRKDFPLGQPGCALEDTTV
jgi:ribosomal protein S18 acetylase RimI-like enzyme